LEPIIKQISLDWLYQIQTVYEPDKYHISRPIRRTFSPEKCDLNSTCILCAKGKYYFQTYKYLYISYMKKVTHQVKTTVKMILVAVTTIFWVSMMNKLYYGC